MSLAIFDLDNTLIADDSDHLWGQFLVEQNLVDSTQYAKANTDFYNDYCRGQLDIVKYLEFALSFLAEHPVEQLKTWRHQFIEEKIKPLLLPAAISLVSEHRRKDDTLIVITATNRFVTEPIVELFGIEHLLATDPEMLQGQYTGNVSGVPCYQQGKVTRLQQWLGKQKLDLKGSVFYSDSHNDLPLLKKVAQPIAVDPDETLRNHAIKKKWRIISLR